jgi:hypothetical protein
VTYDPYIEPGSSLRPLGIVVRVALLIDVLLNAILIPELIRQRSLVQDLASDPASVSEGDATSVDDTVSTLSHVLLGALIITVVLFVIWFYRARVNADGFDDRAHRWARPWAFWGWICPIANLWFPYQIATDILRASDREPGSRSSDRTGYPLFRAWWAFWLGAFVSNRLVAANDHLTDIDKILRYENLEIADSVVEIIVGALAILVVGKITASNDRFRAAVLAAPWLPAPRPDAG